MASEDDHFRPLASIVVRLEAFPQSLQVAYERRLSLTITPRRKWALKGSTAQLGSFRVGGGKDAAESRPPPPYRSEAADGRAEAHRPVNDLRAPRPDTARKRREKKENKNVLPLCIADRPWRHGSSRVTV